MTAILSIPDDRILSEYPGTNAVGLIRIVTPGGGDRILYVYQKPQPPADAGKEQSNVEGIVRRDR